MAGDDLCHCTRKKKHHTITELEQCEGTKLMRIFTPADLDLWHLERVRVSYTPKNIHTEAIQATVETIGKLALEFEADLCEGANDLYFFVFAERGTDEDPKPPVSLCVRVNHWLVALRGELHVFPDVVFQNTFEFEEHTLKGIQLPAIDVQNPSGGLHSRTTLPGLQPKFKQNDLVRVKRDSRIGQIQSVEVEDKTGAPIVVYFVELAMGDGQWFREEELEVRASHPEQPEAMQ